jgi:hypothetical protein
MQYQQNQVWSNKANPADKELWYALEEYVNRIGLAKRIVK